MAVTQYSRRSIWVHWLSAILLLLVIPTGLAMSETEADVTKIILYKIHFIIGILVFMIAIFHVYIFFKDERPAKIDTGNPFRNKVVDIIHRLLTIFIIILTITGAISLFTTQIWEAILMNNYLVLSKYYDSVFVTIHHIQGMIFILLILLHIGGILLHFFSRNRNVLYRMGLKI